MTQMTVEKRKNLILSLFPKQIYILHLFTKQPILYFPTKQSTKKLIPSQGKRVISFSIDPYTKFSPAELEAEPTILQRNATA